MSQHPSSAGFTLIELVIVITIIGIMTVLSVGAFVQQQKNENFRSSILLTESLINYARNQAISSEVANSPNQSGPSNTLQSFGIYLTDKDPTNTTDHCNNQYITIFQIAKDDTGATASNFDCNINQDKIIKQEKLAGSTHITVVEPSVFIFHPPLANMTNKNNEALSDPIRICIEMDNRTAVFNIDPVSGIIDTTSRPKTTCK